MRTGCDSIKAPIELMVVVLTLALSTSAFSLPSSQKIKPRGLGIFEGPAPSPENGPPLSAGALRNKKFLPAEIGGIVGAYLLSLIVIAVVLLTCARKSRRRAQLHRIPVDVEMIVAQPKALSIHQSNSFRSPTSPRNFSWPSPEKDERNPYVFPTVSLSPITPPGTDPYVDSRVVEQDKEMAARNLEDIYAHVMEQDEARANGIGPNELPSPVALQRPGAIPTPAPQRSVTSPKKLDKGRRPANITLDDDKSTRSRASSILSAFSPRRKPKSRPLEISSPLPTPKSATFPYGDEFGDREPLTPKYYKPPPPVPTDQTPYSHSRNVSNITPTSPTMSIAEQLAPYVPSGSGNQYQRHRPNPSTTSIHSNDPVSATSTTPLTQAIPPSKRGPPPSITLHPIPTASNPPSFTNASSRALPFRQYEPSMKSPSFKPTVKTTVLERTGPQHSGPMTGGLRTPWTAGAVPYSPFYQPQTPMIPITPRLVTKEDRKMMKRQEKKMGPVQELVTSSDELWDSGY